MKYKTLAWLPLAFLSTLHAQTSAFTYQGRLNDGGTAANGIYDLRFAIYDSQAGGNSVSGALTNSATGINDGLFTVTLDFGSGLFNGADRWLEMGVRTNGASTFTILNPRQQLTPAPYAIYSSGAATANSAVTASTLSGTLPASQLTGTIGVPHLPDILVTNNATAVNLKGSLASNESKLLLRVL